MSTEVETFKNDFVRVIHQPGNGTRYEAVGVKMPDDFPDVGGAWLVTFPLIGVSHFFRPKGFLAVGYVAEKFKHDRNGLPVCEVDLNEMAKVGRSSRPPTHRATFRTCASPSSTKYRSPSRALLLRRGTDGKDTIGSLH
jgi:hypothetical protein